MSFNDGGYSYAILDATSCAVAGFSGAYFASVEIPASVTNAGTTYNVTEIGVDAFIYNTEITSVTIPNSMLTIGSQAFYNCSSLTNVQISASVTELGGNAFGGCTSLQSVTFVSGSNLQTLGNYVFNGCSNLSSIAIPAGVTSLSNRIFNGCTSLTSVTFDSNNNLKFIDDRAFASAAFSSIAIPNSVTSIMNYVFTNCASLTSITIPSLVASIGAGAFNGCSVLNNVYFLGTSIPTIADGTSFSGIASSNTAYYLNDAIGNDTLSTYFPSPQKIVQLNLISGNGGITSSNITGTTADIAWNLVPNATQGAYSGSLNYYITTNPATSTFTGTNISSKTLTGLTALTSYVVDVLYNINGVPLEIAETSFTMACFKSGTKILTDKGYVVIDNLRKGHMVKTLMNGYLPIDSIGKKDIYHIASKDRIPAQLYKCSQDKYPGLFEDLVITGCHSILIDDFKDKEEEDKVLKMNNGRHFITDDKERLPACLDERALVYETPGNYTIFHFALENDNYYENYGIYANGLLVETCSKRYLNELTNMKLL